MNLNVNVIISKIFSGNVRCEKSSFHFIQSTTGHVNADFNLLQIIDWFRPRYMCNQLKKASFNYQKRSLNNSACMLTSLTNDSSYQIHILVRIGNSHSFFKIYSNSYATNIIKHSLHKWAFKRNAIIFRVHFTAGRIMFRRWFRIFRKKLINNFIHWWNNCFQHLRCSLLPRFQTNS